MNQIKVWRIILHNPNRARKIRLSLPHFLFTKDNSLKPQGAMVFMQIGKARHNCRAPQKGFSFIGEVPHDYTRSSAGPSPAHEMSLEGGNKSRQGKFKYLKKIIFELDTSFGNLNSPSIC